MPLPDKLKRLVSNVSGPCAEFGVGHAFWEFDLSFSAITSGARLCWGYSGEAIIMSNIRVLDCLNNICLGFPEMKGCTNRKVIKMLGAKTIVTDVGQTYRKSR